MPTITGATQRSRMTKMLKCAEETNVKEVIGSFIKKTGLLVPISLELAVRIETKIWILLWFTLRGKSLWISYKIAS